MENIFHVYFLCGQIFRFSTSRQTLTCIPDTFFTALLSGRISSLRDDSGAIFIDRDPTLFGIILNYMRTRDIDIKQCDLRMLRHEAEYYNISPLVRRLVLCEDLNHSSCGDVWFYAHLTPPVVPVQEFADSVASSVQTATAVTTTIGCTTNVTTTDATSTTASSASSSSSVGVANEPTISVPVVPSIPLANGSILNARPGSMVRVPEMTSGSA